MQHQAEAYDYTLIILLIGFSMQNMRTGELMQHYSSAESDWFSVHTKSRQFFTYSRESLIRTSHIQKHWSTRQQKTFFLTSEYCNRRFILWVKFFANFMDLLLFVKILIMNNMPALFIVILLIRPLTQCS